MSRLSASLVTGDSVLKESSTTATFTKFASAGVSDADFQKRCKPLPSLWEEVNLAQLIMATTADEDATTKRILSRGAFFFCRRMASFSPRRVWEGDPREWAEGFVQVVEAWGFL